MRKRLVIGAMAAVVVGVAAYFGAKLFADPPEGSVEWHKRQYLASKDQITRALRERSGKASVGERVDASFHRLARKPYRRTTFDIREALAHQTDSWNALCRLGYLRRETFLVEHQQNFRILPLVEESAEKELPAKSIWRVTIVNGPENRLVVWASGDEMGRLEQLIRKADVPETK